MHTPPFVQVAASEMGVGTDLVSAISANDLVGWICLLILGAMSILSGAVMIQKGRQILAAGRESQAFQRRAYRRDGGLEQVFAATREHANSPLATMAREVYVECEAEDWFRTHDPAQTQELQSRAPSLLENTIDRVIATEQARLENGLYLLAIASTIGPFIGLFGTVWGILGAFQALGREGASLAALAPGLSTALVTTIFGLFVAIPAVLAYNILTARIIDLSSGMDKFANELMSMTQREILRRGGLIP